MLKPEVVIALAVPTLELAKVPVAAPLSVTVSPTTGLMAAAPPKVATVLPS